MSKRYWQVSAGAHGRDYSDRFLEFGMAFVGLEFQHLVNQVKVGDIIILKKGRTEIIAVGEVVNRNGKCNGFDDKEWLKDFDGWVLSSYCYVDWRKPDNNIEIEGLDRKAFSRVFQKSPQELADKIILSEILAHREEPNETNKVKDEMILEYLIREGLRPAAADELTKTIEKIRLLAKYYYYNSNSWDEIKEHETRTFLVIPFLLALGWSEQQLKIEYPITKGKVDIACFSKPFNKHNKNNDCLIIVETKGFASGLDYAHTQAKLYANSFPKSRVIIVSNGYCYKAFVRSQYDFENNPTAYFNILNPTERYPIDHNVGGALDLLKWLIPSRIIPA